MADAELDARHLTCPLPILKTKKALSALPAGGTLQVLATDPNTPADMAAFAKARGHTILIDEASDGVFRFVLRRGG